MCALPKGQTQINPLISFLFFKDNMKEFDIAVIGGGPAGLMAAYAAASNGHAVTLIEKNEKLGKKIKTEKIKGERLNKKIKAAHRTSKIRDAFEKIASKFKKKK